MLRHAVPIAAVVAAVSGWSTVHHCRVLLHDGVGLEDGGGWAALILVEFTTCMAAVAVALSF